ncbi:hypothetical protein RFI_19483 [Reticulomyxa filosa]|uniref:Uncharacterized protein n=1 Tax=Reticulomyxa filosa TaxID=46433 RepID=X6MV06_RETFI|nr:hypothetical protein RFI_19483 [Reticulomyxa filosa]|eukprot:ETO17828.1 hypothetical protein RFI_19483 [Reticulomyxa filosa]
MKQKKINELVEALEKAMKNLAATNTRSDNEEIEELRMELERCKLKEAKWDDDIITMKEEWNEQLQQQMKICEGNCKLAFDEQISALSREAEAMRKQVVNSFFFFNFFFVATYTKNLAKKKKTNT